jgi:hypothetical protein
MNLCLLRSGKTEIVFASLPTTKVKVEKSKEAVHSQVRKQLSLLLFFATKQAGAGHSCTSTLVNVV